MIYFLMVADDIAVLVSAFAKNEQSDLTVEQRRSALDIMRGSRMAEKEFDLGEALKEGLNKALSWKRGELALEVVNVDPMPAQRIREIRRKVAKSAKDFERRFGIPAATVNNWEQGRRRPDPAGRLLLQVIEAAPDVVEKAARQSS